MGSSYNGRGGADGTCGRLLDERRLRPGRLGLGYSVRHGRCAPRLDVHGGRQVAVGLGWTSGTGDASCFRRAVVRLRREGYI